MMAHTWLMMAAKQPTFLMLAHTLRMMAAKQPTFWHAGKLIADDGCERADVFYAGHIHG